ncbi:putative endolysin [Streptomyces ambofaciens ATCC 23877]|uniref:Putative endolysin n=1 Tax=Streptomyces ambofaciens (strain ATCC 23877 / 3486 / DSM 40053 / JCM 4204 / NBRC 12836 / NRRL B-2516) TaxID=278992 RepID=A3KI74_STRA7|nr:peptidoglycan-binding protein [Streptomyces ambofaciens]AKZ53519.1 putative endolysin [Streptomyces ambofaciens ATCC 23877]CAJ89402.1 putative endolysin [Streptomyces ambofaciens ATCC 23877]
MPTPWMPQALRADVGDHAPCDAEFPARAIAHITADREATAAAPLDLVPFANLKGFFTGGGKSRAPHVLWDPFTGAFAQFLPATSRSKALFDAAGGTRTNRAGKVVIQIEALFFPHCRVEGEVFARLVDTPCKGWADLHSWISSWGVPDVWPMGRPTSLSRNTCPADTWRTRGGWYAHGQVPENNHVDPGSWPSFAPRPGEPSPSEPLFEPFPGASFFQAGRRSPVIAGMHGRLVAVDCDRYASGTGIDVWGAGDVRSYTAWQQKLGFQDSEADGIPGRFSWERLEVPRS